MATLSLHYVNRHGAHCTDYFPESEAAERLAAMKRAATLRDETGAIVGKVWINDGSWGDGRKIWLWSYYR